MNCNRVFSSSTHCVLTAHTDVKKQRSVAIDDSRLRKTAILDLHRRAIVRGFGTGTGKELSGVKLPRGADGIYRDNLQINKTNVNFSLPIVEGANAPQIPTPVLGGPKQDLNGITHHSPKPS